MGGGTESKGTESRRQRSCFPATHRAVSPSRRELRGDRNVWEGGAKGTWLLWKEPSYTQGTCLGFAQRQGGIFMYLPFMSSDCLF